MGLFTVTFWGVRGSIPAPGHATADVGGNTSCVQVRAGEDLIILDMGSGVRALGAALGKNPVTASIFLSHYHWDHIQGLPFFGPAYNPASVLSIHGAVREGKDAHELLCGQMTGPYFPVPLEALRAKLGFIPITSGQTVMVGETKVTAHELNHPNGVLGYRIERFGKAVVYATDTEHGTRADDALVELARGAELLIYDAMYTEEEYQAARVGWGHSTWVAGLKILERAGAKRLVLFHHEPTRTDVELEELLRVVRRENPDTLLAREGETITL
jgi:phosphoribosyl 1,2-cyclic phosphodiesterase